MKGIQYVNLIWFCNSTSEKIFEPSIWLSQLTTWLFISASSTITKTFVRSNRKTLTGSSISSISLVTFLTIQSFGMVRTGLLQKNKIRVIILMSLVTSKWKCHSKIWGKCVTGTWHSPVSGWQLPSPRSPKQLHGTQVPNGLASPNTWLLSLFQPGAQSSHDNPL